MFYYEVFIQKDNVEPADWDGFINLLYKFSKHFSLEVFINGGEIRYFISSSKNLGTLNAEDFILQESKPLEGKAAKSHFLWLRTKHDSLITVAQKQKVKKGKYFLSAIFHFNRVLKGTWYHARLNFQDDKKIYTSHKWDITTPGQLLAVDFSKTFVYRKRPMPLYLKDIDQDYSDYQGFLNIHTFPTNYNKNISLNNFDFDKHSVILGQTGVGKSKFLALFIKELEKNNPGEYSVVVVDPHASLIEDLRDLNSRTNIDFINTHVDLFPTSADPNISSELTILLLKSMLKDQFNAKLERVLKYSLYTLFTQNKVSTKNLKLFLTDIAFRKEVLQSVEADHIKIFFDTEYTEISTKFYETAVMPILTLLDELSFLPVFNKDTVVPIEGILENNFLTCFSLNKMTLGEKSTKLLAGLLIQQVFLYAQKKKTNKKILLIIDEVPVVENEAFKQILAEARKFNLSLFLSAQHLSQVSKDLTQSILANTYNYFIFRIAEDDAKTLGANLKMEFDDRLMRDYKDKGFKEEDMKLKLFTDLNQRECIVRTYHNGVFYPCVKAVTANLA